MFSKREMHILVSRQYWRKSSGSGLKARGGGRYPTSGDEHDEFRVKVAERIAKSAGANSPAVKEARLMSELCS